MRINYIDEKGELLSSTEDYVPDVGEWIDIDNVSYEVEDKKVKIIALHTEIDVRLVERIHG